MSTSITFTDAIGPATLTNQKIVPGDRFSHWEMNSEPFGQGANRQSDGALTFMRFRDDFWAKFELPGIPSLASGSPLVSMYDIADRLKYFLLIGGVCSVNTGDVSNNVYATCGLFPGTKPELVMTDQTELEYTFRVQVLNLAVSPSRMVCRYANQ